MAERDVPPPGFFDVRDEDSERREDYERVIKAAQAAKESLEADGAQEVEVWIIAKSKTGDQIGTQEHQRECASTWSGDFYTQVGALDVLADMTRGVIMAMTAWAEDRGEEISLDATKGKLEFDGDD